MEMGIGEVTMIALFYISPGAILRLTLIAFNLYYIIPPFI